MQPESTILRFIQLLPQASPEGDFLLKDLPGSGKRIDVLCRDLAACFSWGPIIWSKERLELIAVIANSCILTFSFPGTNTPRNEVQWATVIRDSLRKQPPNYVRISEGSIEDIMKRYNLPPKSKLWVLEEGGLPISKIWEEQSFTQNSFMLGDHRGFDSQTDKLISEHALLRLSLGKNSYLSSHCVALIISEFERIENVE